MPRGPLPSDRNQNWQIWWNGRGNQTYQVWFWSLDWCGLCGVLKIGLFFLNANNNLPSTTVQAFDIQYVSHNATNKLLGETDIIVWLTKQNTNDNRFDCFYARHCCQWKHDNTSWLYYTVAWLAWCLFEDIYLFWLKVARPTIWMVCPWLLKEIAVGSCISRCSLWMSTFSTENWDSCWVDGLIEPKDNKVPVMVLTI